MKTAALVAIFGATGCLLRFWVGSFLQSKLSSNWPWGTLCVNLIGCFLIGYLMQDAVKAGIADSVRSGLVVGLLGGLTTFSSFQFELLQLAKSNIKVAVAYLFVSLTFGFFCVLAGDHVATRVYPVTSTVTGSE